MNKTKQYIIDAIPKLKEVNLNDINEYERKLKTIAPTNNNNGITEQEAKEILDFVITRFRELLSTTMSIDIANDPLTNKCDFAQAIVGYSLERIGADVRLCESQMAISNDVEGHSFLIVGFPINENGNINKKFYLVDPTYRQFFLQVDCTDKNYLIKENLILIAPKPGYYYTYHPNKIQTAIKLIEDGYIELNNDSAKTYGDSFYVTHRGYINLANQAKQSNIPGDIFMNAFLKGRSHYSMSEEDLALKGYQIFPSLEEEMSKQK